MRLSIILLISCVQLIFVSSTSIISKLRRASSDGDFMKTILDHEKRLDLLEDAVATLQLSDLALSHSRSESVSGHSLQRRPALRSRMPSSRSNDISFLSPNYQSPGSVRLMDDDQPPPLPKK